MSIEVKISRNKVPYKKSMFILEKRVEDVQKGLKKEFLWILEHPTTYTSGIRSSDNEILDKKIKIIKTNRGGKITLHNPGQKIIYFVINLNKRKKDIRRLVSILENAIIQLLSVYDIKGKKDKDNIGIWVGGKKIAAIGLRVSRWVAYHGCSINVNNNLDQYLKIRPCGLNNQNVTSIFFENQKKIKNINNNIKKIFIKKISKI